MKEYNYVNLDFHDQELDFFRREIVTTLDKADESDFEVIAEFEEGDQISKDRELFAPMEITWF